MKKKAEELVDELVAKHDTAFQELINAVRKSILRVDKEIEEQVKWNSPSMFYTGAIPEFDPKEYKRDLVVFHLRKGIVLLVFPTGVIIKNEDKFLEGNYTDGRRMLTIKNLEDFKLKERRLQEAIKDWIKKSK